MKKGLLSPETANKVGIGALISGAIWWIVVPRGFTIPLRQGASGWAAVVTGLGVALFVIGFPILAAVLGALALQTLRQGDQGWWPGRLGVVLGLAACLFVTWGAIQHVLDR